MTNAQDVIEVCEYDPAWPERFLAERKVLAAAFGERAKDIQHIGSTAVPGLGAKPIVDILVAVEALEQANDYRALLDQLGYVNVPHDEDARRLFFCKGAPRQFHLHVIKFRSWTYWKHIIFRDYLLEHPTTLEEYQCLKIVLANRFHDDRDAYVEGKADFIEMVMERAVKERLFYPNPFRRCPYP